jgi:hypothetical protein
VEFDSSFLNKLDLLCLDYGRNSNFMVMDCPNLVLLSKNLSQEINNKDVVERLLSLAWEIKIGFIHSIFEMSTLAGIENEYIVEKESKKHFLPFEDIKSFSIANRRARAAFALTARIRSLYDKLFLYICLIEGGNDLVKKLQSQKSKRKFFFRHFSDGVAGISRTHLESVSEDINFLESNHRTPELHGFGTIRSWAYRAEDKIGSESHQLMGHWNILNRFIHQVFVDSATNITSIAEA